MSFCLPAKFFFLMIRRPPRSTQRRSSAASDVYKRQDVGYASRPFTLTSLPIRRPPKGQLIHERRNGKFRLQVVGHPEYGLPWGVDRLVILWTATAAIRQKSRVIRFRSGADI